MCPMLLPAGNPAWRAAPTVLLRFRSLFTAFVVGSFLVSVVASAYPMFLSASQNDLLADTIDNGTVTRYGMGLAYRSTDVPIDADGGRVPLWRRRGEAFASEAARSSSLDAVEGHIFGGVVTVTGLDGSPPPTGVVDGRLFAGTGAIEHAEVRSGVEGDGLWLPDIVAEPLSVGPGDEVLLHSPAGEARVAVDGVYEGLYSQPRRGYWRLWNDDIYPCPEVDCVPPPQFIIAEPEQLLELSRTLGFERANFAWQAPSRTDPPLTLNDAIELAAFERSFLQRASTGGGSYALFRCCGRWFTRDGSTEITVTGNAGLVVQDVEQRIAAVQGPMVVLLLAGLAIALGVVAAAGLFAVAARRVEVGVLSNRGWGPAAFGMKASVEVGLPAVLGGLTGWLAAAALVAVVGPDAPPAPSAKVAAAAAALVGTLVAIVIVGVVSAFASAARHEHRHRVTRLLAAIPWEIGFFALAWIFAGRLSEGGVRVVDGVERPQAEVYVLPLMVAVGAGIVCARLARLALRWATSAGGSGAGATWLAARRLRSGATLTSLFLVAGVLTLSVSTTASSTVASLRATVDAKSKIFVGSDVQVRVTDDADPAPGYPYAVTLVTRMRDAGSIEDGEARYDLLVVEPDGFDGCRVLGRLVRRRAAPDVARSPRRTGEWACARHRRQRCGRRAGVRHDRARGDARGCRGHRDHIPGHVVGLASAPRGGPDRARRGVPRAPRSARDAASDDGGLGARPAGQRARHDWRARRPAPVGAHGRGGAGHPVHRCRRADVPRVAGARYRGGGAVGRRRRGLPACATA